MPQQAGLGARGCPELPHAQPAGSPHPLHPSELLALGQAQGVLTGVELEEQLDRVVVEVAAVQDHLDERGEAALPRSRDRHRA